jgi:hypothetical protein
MLAAYPQRAPHLISLRVLACPVTERKGMQPAWFSHYYRIDLKQVPERYEDQSLIKIVPASLFALKLRSI